MWPKLPRQSYDCLWRRGWACEPAWACATAVAAGCPRTRSKAVWLSVAAVGVPGAATCLMCDTSHDAANLLYETHGARTLWTEGGWTTLN